jgi:hypothetical protein
MDVKISKASGNDITLVVTPQAKQTIVIDRTASKGTVTSVAAVGGTGISVTGSPITSDGTLTITNTAPDQTVALTAGTGITTSGTYPNFTITNSLPDRTVAFTNGTGISTSGTYPNFTITNTAPDQTVALTGAGTTTVTGTYPNFTITSTSSSGTVTGVTGTTPIVSSGGTAPAISITSSGANSAVLRDSNLNISANSISEGYSNVAAAGTTTILTAASVPNYVVTGSGGQTYQLPDATTLANGTNYQFNNNQSSGTIIVKNNSGTTVATIQSGGFVDVSLLSNAIAAGSWDTHNIAPSNVSWSTNTFDYAGSITSATWNGATVQVNRGGTGASTLTGYVKGTGTTAMTASATIPVGDISATGTPSSTTYLRGDSTWATIAVGMVYPAAGIPNSTGTAWGTSYTTSGSGTIVALSDSPTFTTAITSTGALQLTGDATANQNIATNQTSGNLFIGSTSSGTGNITFSSGQTTGILQFGSAGATGSLNLGVSTGAQPINIVSSAASASIVNIGGTGLSTGAINIGRSTGTQTISIGSGNVTSGQTRTINIGTASAITGVSNVNIGKFSTTVAHTTSFAGNTMNFTANNATVSANAGFNIQSGSAGMTINTGSGSNTTIGALGNGDSLTVNHDNTSINSGTVGLGTTSSLVRIFGAFEPPQYSSAPAYSKGRVYFDTTLNKLRVGGATTWETITSV